MADYRIMVIDDDYDSRLILQRHLSSRGYHVNLCDSPTCALERLEDYQPDLIVLDYILPEQDGVSLLYEIRKIEPDVPAIMLTAYSTTHLAVEFMKEGGLDFIEKPVRSGEILDLKIKLVLEKAYLKKKEEQSKIDRFRNGILSMISHELRTPLAILQSSSDILKKYNHRIDEEQRKNQLSRIQMAVSRLSDLVDSVVRAAEFRSHSEEDLFGSTLDLISLDELIQLVLNNTDARNRISSAHLKLEINIDPFLPPVRASMSRMILSISSVLDNAIKFTTAGSISITGDYNSNTKQVLLNICDTGPGIPPGDRARVFLDFEKVSSDGAVEGAGLGLGFAHNLIQKDGGDLTLLQSGPEGSCFQFSLPISL